MRSCRSFAGFHSRWLSSMVTTPRSASAASLRFAGSTPRKLFATLSCRMESTSIDEVAKAGCNVEYMPLESVETLERYRPGGYHPVVIGDYLHDRYHVVHKLGFGTYSTTWLARDRNARSYVAIKIAVANDDSRDVDILHLLRDKHSILEGNPGQIVVPPVLGEFDLDGPNGNHRCLVTAPARMSLADAKDASVPRLFQPSVARAIVAQLVQAVAFLHSRGIVHAGR